MSLDTSKIIQLPLKEDQYYKEEFQKLQLVIHHTSGGSNPINVVSGWNANEERVGTAFIIAGKPQASSSTYKDGEIYQTFSSKYWAHSLGIKAKDLPSGSKSNLALNQNSIAIEITSWGGLTKTSAGKFMTYVNTEVPASEVCELATPFKGFKYYHKYTPAQLASLKDLLVYLADKFSIPKHYNADMWDVSKAALKGTPGIYTHVSYRHDKSDAFPQPELIALLQSLA